MAKAERFLLCEGAIREWARYAAEAAATLQSVNGKRLAHAADLFSKAGFSNEEAASKARLLYGALIGLETL